jgi:hypothetical protein
MRLQIVAAVVAASAAVCPSAHAATHCTPEGRAVPLSAADTPDRTRTLRPWAKADLTPREWSGDVHAYPRNGGRSQQFACSARHQVDTWLEWRTPNGRLVARFDGVRFRAGSRGAIVAAWFE